MLYSRSLLVIYFVYSTVSMLIRSPGNRPNPEIEPRSPALQADSLPAEPQGKPKYTEVGSLSIRKWVAYPFSSRSSRPKNWTDIFLHCKESEVAQSCLTLRPHGLLPTRLLHPWDFPGKSTGEGSHFLLQGIFMIQGLDPGLPCCRQTLYRLSHTAGGFFNNWAIREALC